MNDGGKGVTCDDAPAHLPPWPTRPVAYGPVVLRAFSALDVPMAMELSTVHTSR